MCLREVEEESLLNHNIPTTTEPFNDALYDFLSDAHCHPHDDVEHLGVISQLRTGHLTIMGVRLDDWDRVAQVAHSETKCVPCFGNY